MISDYLQEQTKKDETKTDDTNKIIEVKDEQILLLKESMSWMKNQYQDEINRIEKNQKRIIKVFNNEVKLLQSAFNEMRSIYQIEQKENKSENFDFEFMSVKDFFIFMKKHKKNDIQIKHLILNRIKNKDKRFIFDKNSKELKIFNCDYSDLL